MQKEGGFLEHKKSIFIKKRLHLIIIRASEGCENLRVSKKNINFAHCFDLNVRTTVNKILKNVHFAK